MDIRFDGKRALVTGAGKGIGRALTLRLKAAGAGVLAVSRTQSDLDELQQIDSGISTLCLDIGDWDQTRKCLEGVGPFDLLVNNAGILDLKEFGQWNEEDVDRTMDINVKSIINVSQIVSSQMKANGKGGSIVNVSSFLAYLSLPKYAVYCASKGAVDQLARNMAIELGPFNIRVNSVNPTVVRTRMAMEVGAYEEGNKLTASLLERTPLGRFAEIEDVVNPILFLLSDKAAMVTGITLPVDGGVGVVA